MTTLSQAYPRWTRRFSHWTQRLGITAIVIALLGVLLARYDVIPKLMGLNAMLGGTLLALIGTVAGLIAVILNLRTKAGLMRAALIGLILSGGYFGFMASRAAVAGKVPAIHDITTDLTNPPAFATIKLGADNLRGVGTVATWHGIHAKAYADLKPVTIAKPVAVVIANAEKIAKANGWAVAVADPAAGRLEATASVSLIRFQDDVVVRAVATPDGKGSVVDMRSVSRVGISDLGVNAKRVRAFLADLAKG
jgi:uncharacterized protein (DUF1499 family)